jgi:hypothetical protein
MQEFVAWDLEKEHGDLGLSVLNLNKPPMSKLGVALCEDRTGATISGILREIVNTATGNVSIAKLGLDLVHSAQSMESIESTPDRLPGNLVALFDEGIKHIEQQPQSQQDLGFRAIAAAAHNLDGVPLIHLERLLRDTTPVHNQLNMPPRSLEDVLRAAKGFLFLRHSEDYDVTLYHPIFPSYVTEEYNQSLVWAISQLRTSKISRSVTQIDSKKGNDERSTQFEDQLRDITKTIKFEEPRKSNSFGEKSVFTLSRSATAFSLGNRRGEIVRALRQLSG